MTENSSKRAMNNEIPSSFVKVSETRMMVSLEKKGYDFAIISHRPPQLMSRV